MKHLKLHDAKTISLSTQSAIRLEYYLVETPVFPSPLYGIRIQSHPLNHENNLIHAEEIPNLSYSRQEVLQLLCHCIQYQVTPTDLIYALDILMNHL